MPYAIDAARLAGRSRTRPVGRDAAARRLSRAGAVSSTGLLIAVEPADRRHRHRTVTLTVFAGTNPPVTVEYANTARS